MTEEIYIALLDEGMDVWRPVPAEKVGNDSYRILPPDDYNPDDEKWQFPPGSTVICERRKLSDGTVLAAVRQAAHGRKTA